jgi:hypothetical protein
VAVIGAVAVGAYLGLRAYGRSHRVAAEAFSDAWRERAAGQPSPTGADTMVVASMDRLSPIGARAPEEDGAVAPLTDLRQTGERLAEPAPRRRRLSGVALAALATAVGIAAIAIGAAAVIVATDSDSSSVAQPTQQELISLLSKPATERVPLQGSGGRIVLVAAPNGRAYLILDGLGLAPSGKTYQAWVIKPGAKAPASAGVFEGSELVVPLAVAVQPGAVVAITIERAGGVRAPTQQPRIVGSV